MYYYTPSYGYGYGYGYLPMYPNVISRSQTGCPFFYWPPPYWGPPLYGTPIPKKARLDPTLPKKTRLDPTPGKKARFEQGGSGGGSGGSGGGGGSIPPGPPSSSAPNPYYGNPPMTPHQLHWLRAQQAYYRRRFGGRRGY